MTELTTTEGIAQSLLPYYTEGGKKASYLSYIMAGFSIMESIKLAGIHVKTRTRWKEDDPMFVELEGKASTELRRQLADQLIDIEFTRNFRLVMAKDFKVLFKDAAGEEALTETEQAYLMQIRKFYTPQQFLMLRQLISGNLETKDQGFDFTRTLLEIKVTKETVTGGK
ncbi:hypothetical protein LCGC14_0392900 [marine sediment metagenome]|uniref:Uncharacterized protein n=1 Tax=marine sediment metagenome TaxID=412755 RepID=A0A0F9T4T8_9ZZZZ